MWTPDHRTLSHFKIVQSSGSCSNMTSFLHESFSLHLQMVRWTVSTDRSSSKGLQPCPRWDVSNFSESFDDVLHCRWWDSQSLCRLSLKNIVFKVSHNLSQIGEPLSIFTSERLWLSKTPLFFISNHVTGPKSINFISYKMFYHLISF